MSSDEDREVLNGSFSEVLSRFQAMRQLSQRYLQPEHAQPTLSKLSSSIIDLLLGKVLTLNNICQEQSVSGLKNIN